jgi:hypothetical protein
MTLRNTMTLLTDYRDLNGIIESNPKFAPSDLDMIYERNSQFLVVEWKKPNEEFGGGQKIMLKALAKTVNFTVLTVCGYSENTKLIIYDFKQITTLDTLKHLGQGKQAFINYIQDWYKRADNVQE